jgi:amino acid transporter
MSTKTLKLPDLCLYGASMALSMRWISVAAATGPASLPIWVLAIVVFSGPLIVATADLTTRFTGEGGVYNWTRETFGPFWGFLCGWLYWTCNLPFFSGLLYFMVNLLALALGPAGKPILDQPLLFAAIAIFISILVGVFHLKGMGSGKWLSNIGGFSNLTLMSILILVGAVVFLSRGSATDFVHASYAPPLNANGAILWATMVFGVGGSEALAFLRNDVRGGMKTILMALVFVAAIQIFFYLSDTAAMLAILTPEGATRLSGLPDALILGLKTLGLSGLAPFVLMAAFLGTLGSYSAWFGVAARLPFAAGIDDYLPKAFGRRDPKSGAPVVSIAVQMVIVIGLVVLSQVGENLKAGYDFLVAMSVLSYTLPFLFLFMVYLGVHVRPAVEGGWKLPGGRTTALVVGGIGMAATVTAVACTLVPSPDAKDQVGEALKLVEASAVLILSGCLAYGLTILRRRRRRMSGGVA